jgi:hypothetical protein
MLLALLLVGAGDWFLLQEAAEGVASIHCHYTQEKRSPLFKQAVRSQGAIAVAYSDKGPELHLKVEQPDKMKLDVVGDHASMESGGKKEDMPIDKLPKVQSFLGAFSELFLGHTDALQKVFTLDATRRDGEGMTAALVPKDASFLQRVTVTFADGTAQRIVLDEDGGDQTTIVLTQCNVKRR